MTYKRRRPVALFFFFLLVFCFLCAKGEPFRFGERNAAGISAETNLFPGAYLSGRTANPDQTNQGDPPQREAGAGSSALLTELEKEEIAAGKHFQLIDAAGKMITATGHRLRPGDQYLDDQNRLYTVERVEGYLAYASYTRTEKLKKPAPRISRPHIPEGRETFSSKVSHPDQYLSQSRFEDRAAGKAGKGDPGWPRHIIAIYHTHNDECYVPSDGVESIYGRGGIHAVGEAFKEALEEKNIAVVYSEDLHLPHDRDAYLRARGTAAELLEHDPDAIFDLHRDAAPPETYTAEIAENRVTKIQFVVGRENPSFVVNRSFAYDLKALADEIYPGLIKGVLLGWGDFNQDLNPLNLLLEVGTHLNSKEEALSGISLFADVVSCYFYGDSAGDSGKGFDDKAGAWSNMLFRTILMIGGLVAAVLIGFYFLNNPAAVERLQRQWKLYWGRGGLIWQEGMKNLSSLGREIALAARKLIVYLYILTGIIRTVFHRLKQRLKS